METQEKSNELYCEGGKLSPDWNGIIDELKAEVTTIEILLKRKIIIQDGEFEGNPIYLFTEDFCLSDLIQAIEEFHHEKMKEWDKLSPSDRISDYFKRNKSVAHTEMNIDDVHDLEDHEIHDAINEDRRNGEIE